MPDYNSFLKVIKQAAMEAVNSTNPVGVCFGEVKSISPLQILVDQKMTLGSAQVVLTRNVMNYETSIESAWETSEENEHSHDVSGGKATINNGLVLGDKVLMIRMQGGQKYVVIDKVVSL